MRAFNKYYIAAILLLACVGELRAQKEMDYKVNLIKKFASELTYPSTMQKNDEFIVGIVADQSTTDAFMASMGNATVKGKKIVVRQIMSPSDVQLYPIVYHTENTSLLFAGVARAIGGKPILLVTERPGLGAKGSDINLVRANDKWRYEINTDKIRRKGIYPSEPLIKKALHDFSNATESSGDPDVIAPSKPSEKTTVVYREDETKVKDLEDKLRKERKERESLESSERAKDRTIRESSENLDKLKVGLDTMTNIAEVRKITLQKARQAEEERVNRINAENEAQRKAQDAKRREEISNQRFYLVLLLGVLLLISTVAVLSANASRRRKKIIQQLEIAKNSLAQSNQELDAKNQRLDAQNKEIEAQKDALATQNKEIEAQKNELAEKNLKITDSIRYAETIQMAMLPSAHELEAMFSAHFVMYVPKDIVSGDFYWATKQQGGTFIAVADCTGHGVPGAFLSTVGNDILNELIIDKRMYEPNAILSCLHAGIFERLRQNETNNKDGMDICLCRITEVEGGQFEIVFAGAKRPLFYSEGGVIKSVKGDSKYLGGIHEEPPTFRNHTIVLPKGEKLYLTTDGYPDTPNREKRKFGSTKFIELMQEIHSQPLDKQEEIFRARWEEHKNGAELRDDTTVLAVEL